jgi:hypothetical protein
MTPVVQRAKAVKDGIPRFLRDISACTAIAALLFALPAQGQLAAPVAIGTPNPVTDEFGVNLRGSATAPVSECDMVQVLWVNSGIEPPDVYGTPSTNNPPVIGGQSHVGKLTAPGLVNPGIFSVSLYDPRPANSSKIFVRVFNAPKRRDATFYADSQVLTVRDNSLLFLNLSATTNAIDPRDEDGDGLNNSWERSLGADLYNPDTDGDGMTDGEEHRAGTGVLDANSVFVAVQINPAANGHAAVAWDSVAGKRYQVESTDDPWADPVSYTNASGVISADSEMTITTLTNGLSGEMRKYRVRLVEP